MESYCNIWQLNHQPVPKSRSAPEAVKVRPISVSRPVTDRSVTLPGGRLPTGRVVTRGRSAFVKLNSAVSSKFGGKTRFDPQQ